LVFVAVLNYGANDDIPDFPVVQVGADIAAWAALCYC
jgi:hypothetical protein